MFWGCPVGGAREPGFITALSPWDPGLVRGLVARSGGGDCGAPFFRFAAGDGAEIIETLGPRTAERCCSRRIIAVRNTTENKPPGPQIMRAGWDKLAAIATGCHLAVIL